jgi:DNA-binding NtrC family response regulator
MEATAAMTRHTPAVSSSGNGNAPRERGNLSGASTLSISEQEKSTIRVLIVDDEQTLGESCASVLSVEGFDVKYCSRAHEAQSLLKRQAYDIVLLDLHMTQVSGMQLLAECLEAKPDTIAIIMTGNPSVETSIEALRKGAWDYLPKPFAASHLQILLGRAAHAVVVARETEVLAVRGRRGTATATR